MQCPKCKDSMKEISGFSFPALKCNGCHGIWFKNGSHETARTVQGVSAIDPTKSNMQSHYRKIRDISCPECNKKMIKMVDKDQHHIEIESCPYCRGVFFDAGEFRDFVQHSFLERVKQAIKTLKYNLKH